MPKTAFLRKPYYNHNDGKDWPVSIGRTKHLTAAEKQFTLVYI